MRVNGNIINPNLETGDNSTIAKKLYFGSW